MTSSFPPATAAAAGSGLRPTLSSVDYCSSEVFDLERRTIFHRGWMYVCHIDGIPAGTKRVVDIAGESVLLTRDTDGGVHAFANVCRHRGAQLCDAAMTEAVAGSIRCPYHSWTYHLDGRLVATPRVDDEFDRGTMSLWPYHAEVWNGMVFVSLAARPEPLGDWLARTTPWASSFERLPVAAYRIGARTETIVQANWKIILENYSECLHCAVVHPELTELIPLYRTGNVVHPDDPTAPVAFADGRVAFTRTGQSTLSVLPGVGPCAEYDGVCVFPNLFFDLTPTVLALTATFPMSADRSLVVGEYLFAAADLDRPDFDPTPEVEFNELVGAQDYVVCEMVQRGVASKSFAGGGLTRKDEYVVTFMETYLAARGPRPHE
jgi:Rieske 2Fe-2S family protein